MKAGYLAPYIISNVVAIIFLLVACWRPRVARWLFVALFIWASFTNGYTSIVHPEVYKEYAPLAVFQVYRDFINGYFAQHIALFVFPIAIGQMTIAILLTRNGRLLTLGILGLTIFLLAISPLGIGSGFPFSLIVIAAAWIMRYNLLTVGTSSNQSALMSERK